MAGSDSLNNADGIPATESTLDDPTGIAIDSVGDIFIADCWDNRIREVNAVTGIITTVAGTGTEGYNGSDMPATATELDWPSEVAVDSHGNLIICDQNNNRIGEVAGIAPIACTVAQATPTVAVSDAGGIFNGSPFPATATVAGAVSGVDSTPAASLQGVIPTLTYYVGSRPNGSGSATAPTALGTYTVVASFAGSTDYTAAQAPRLRSISRPCPSSLGRRLRRSPSGRPWTARS